MEGNYETDELESGVKGKQAELTVIGELLRRGFEVFQPVLDQGIDCLVKAGEGSYKEIQIKYRENRPVFRVRNLRPRDGFFIVCCLSGGHRDEVWVLPSKVFFERSTPVQGRRGESRQLIIGREGSNVYEALRFYSHNFSQLLGGANREVREAVRQATRRISGPHFKQSDFGTEILRMLASESQPMARKEIVSRLGEHFERHFSEADLAALKSGRPRWEKNARWAITGLKFEGLIEARTRNHWTITPRGREEINRRPRETAIDGV